ncbi:hypothetical protein, partial [Klebsiella pneumoniae]|uniref:hypothetical protein n=1 Tax=Klebsiella pneumoniae TaxID=573 RepID=UPI0039682612
MMEHPNPAEHVKTVLMDGFPYIYAPVDDPVDLMAAVNKLINSDKYRPHYGKISYSKQDGNCVVYKLFFSI